MEEEAPASAPATRSKPIDTSGPPVDLEETLFKGESAFYQLKE